MAAPINPYEYDDPTRPPSGYQAIECPDCSLHYLKPSQAPKMALGPVPGVGLRSERGASLCTACHGRTWVWRRLSSVPPRQGPNDTPDNDA